jgi:hypothetical protein
MIQIATIEIEKAERLMKALCNHFARKITSRYEGDKALPLTWSSSAIQANSGIRFNNNLKCLHPTF